MDEKEKTIFEIKREVQNNKEYLKNLHNQNIEFALSNNAEEIKRIKTEIEQVELSTEVLEKELERREKESAKNLTKVNDDPINNKAIFYRSVIKNEPIPQEVKRNLFGTNLTPSTGAENLIPTSLSNELLYEPIKENPLRSIMTITNIRGLEIPKISYEVENLDFIKDGDTSREIKLKGDKISFGRHKFKIMSKISDTVIYGTDKDLINYVENALKEGLAEKEKYSIFKTSNNGEEHMNLYHTQNGIKEVEGDTLFKAIKLALADLEDRYYENATIVMRRSDYFNMIDDLSNANTNFYDKQPEQVFGVKIIFCEYAEKPIVGDFRQLHLNYDIDSAFESDKDVKSGEHLFVLTAWADIRIKLSSAFRIAKPVSIASTLSRAKKES